MLADSRPPRLRTRLTPLYVFVSLLSVCLRVGLSMGVHPPEAMMYFPLFQISPSFRKKFQTLWTIFTILPFPNKFLDFQPPNFFFTHRPQISNSHPPYFRIFPYFSCLSTFPLCFAKTIISPCFRNIHVFLHALRVFRFPPTLTMMHLCITQCTYWTPLGLPVGVCVYVKGFVLVTTPHEKVGTVGIVERTP